MANQSTIKNNGLESDTCTPPQLVAVGAVGGLMAGVVFGMMMNMLHMIGMVAMLVNSKSTAVGWAVHLIISTAIGITFNVAFGNRLKRVTTGLVYGMAYGVFWWVLGPLILMPAKLKMPLFHFNTATWQSLMGHVVFGMVLGALVVFIPKSMHNQK